MPSPSKATDLTQGPVGRTLLVFALPVLASNILQSLNGSINSIWVGRYLGPAALTATSNANIILFFLLGSMFGVGMAATILVGQAMGAKDIVQAKRVFGTSATFFTAISALVAGVGYLITPAILRAMHTPPDAYELAISYLRVIFVALPSMYALTFLMVVLRGAGDSMTPFFFMILSVVLDIGLNPLFIFGWGPVPRMGIAGAALATFCAQTLCLIAFVIYLYRRKHFLCLHTHELHYLKPNFTILRALLLKGLPMGMQMAVMTTSAIALISMVNGYGSKTTAAYGVATQIWSYVQMPAFAIGAGISAMVAQCVGAKRWDRIPAITWSGITLNIILTGTPAALILLFSGQVMGLFLPGGNETLAIGQHINSIAIWSFLLFGITMVLFGVVRSMGAVMAPLVILFLALWVIRIPFAKALTPYLGADAIWWSFPLGSSIACLLAIVYYRLGTWKKAHMLEKGSVVDPQPVAVIE